MKTLFNLLLLMPILVLAQQDIQSTKILLQQWQQMPAHRWLIDTLLTEDNLLWHQYDNVTSDEDRVSAALPQIQYKEGELIWKFTLRHGYNPSSSNHWAIFLLSSNDARYMTPNMANAYILGVNYNAAGNDQLGLWYQDDKGNTSQILHTDFNLQEMVGTIDYHTFVVKRSSVGRWEIFSENIFSKVLQPIGTCVHHSFFDANYCGIYYKYTKTGDKKLWIKNFEIHYKPNNPTDYSSVIKNPAFQIPYSIIVPEASADTAANAVFRFNICNKSSNNELPSRIKSIEVQQHLPNVNLNEILKNAFLSINQKTIICDSVIIKEHKVLFYFPENELTILQSECVDIELNIILKNKITDGTLFQFCVNSNFESTQVYEQSSAFSQTDTDTVFSDFIEIDVRASRLLFKSVPDSVKRNTPFKIELQAVDSYGNTDNNFCDQIVLSLHEGSGNIEATTALQKEMVGGIVYWQNLSYNSLSAFVLKAVCQNRLLSEIRTSPIVVSTDKDSFLSYTKQSHIKSISSLCDNWGQAQQLFCFYINDPGTSDLIPTKVNQLEIQNSFPLNGADWSNTIAGIRIQTGNRELLCKKTTITDHNITIELLNDELVIPDADSVLVCMLVWLKKTKIVDGSVLQFKIGSQAYQHRTDPSFSGIGNSVIEFLSDKIMVDVLASKIDTEQYPKQGIGVGIHFSYAAKAVDRNGNTDLDFKGEAIMNLNNNTDALMTIENRNCFFSDGVAVWDNISFRKPGLFTLLLISRGLAAHISPPITVADNNSYIELVSVHTDQVIQSITIDSKTPHTIFVFMLCDSGSTDSLPTIISELNFDLVCNNNFSDKTIAGFKIYNHKNDTIAVKSFSVNNNELTITLADNQLQAADSKKEQYSIATYLNKQEVHDHSTLQLRIAANSFDWKCGQGSSIMTDNLPSDILSTVFQLQVIATKFALADFSLMTETNSKFELKIAATDLFNNIDVDFDDNVMLLTNSQLDTVLQAAKKGIAVFNLDAFNNCSLYAASETINKSDTISNFVFKQVDVLINNSFDIPYIMYNNNWSTTEIVRSETESDTVLAHSKTSDQSVSTFAVPSNKIVAVNEGVICWQFTFYWDNNHSVSNYFNLSLLSYFDIKSNTKGQYRVGINPNSNCLSIWDESENSSIKTIISSPFKISEGDVVKVKILKDVVGNWQLWYKANNQYSVWNYNSGQAPVAKLIADSVLINYHSSSSRRGLFQIDDLLVTFAKSPARITHAKIISNDSIIVTFNKPLYKDDVLLPYNIVLRDTNDIDLKIFKTKIDEISNQLVISTFLEQWGNYTLYINNLTDSDGYIVNDKARITYKNSKAEVLFNEIMASPDPGVQLPEAEFIELFNSSNVAVSLNEWVFSYADNKINLPDCKLEAGDYLLMTHTKNYALLSKYGNIIALDNFPVLSNSGQLLQLFNKEKQLVSWVNYSNKWHSNEIKNKGGWSLERISHNYNCEGIHNWTSSTDQRGGSPGEKNTVHTAKTDNHAPILQNAAITNDTVVVLYFNEALNFKHNIETSAFIIDGVDPPTYISSNTPYNNKIKLHYNNPFTKGEYYQLFISELENCNNLLYSSQQAIRLAVPEIPRDNDIVINEILFNPQNGATPFVELYNRSNKVINLAECMIATGKDFETLKYVKPTDEPFMFFPNTYIAICNSKQELTEHYQIIDTSRILQSDANLFFNNKEGSVVLCNRSFQTIDSINYNQEQQYSLMSAEGVSLERINPERSSTDLYNWHSASSINNFASPGSENSQYRIQQNNSTQDMFTLSSDCFSPDNDGLNDRLQINYHTPASGYTCNITIYNDRGEEQLQLLKNELLPAKGQFYWDGIRYNKKNAPVGIYIIFVELFDLHGNIKHYKLPVLLRKR